MLRGGSFSRDPVSVRTAYRDNNPPNFDYWNIGFRCVIASTSLPAPGATGAASKPTATSVPPTDTPVPPADAPVPESQTGTPVAEPTDAPVPELSDTPASTPTHTPTVTATDTTAPAATPTVAPTDPCSFADFNGDRQVDWLDVGPASAAYGSSSGDPGYREACDTNGDGVIDWTDIGQVSSCYGSSW